MKEIFNIMGRLASAAKEKDGSAQMTQSLASMDFPQLTSVLPYRDYDKESGLFVNRKTVGFLLEATPLIGASEQIVQVLEDMVKSKLPRKTPLAFHLVASKVIGEQMDEGLSQFRWEGEHAQKFNHITRAYYQRAAQQSFNNPPRLPLTLRDYRLYISCCVKAKKNNAAAMTAITHTMKVLRASLDAAKIATEPADPQGLVNLVSSMINHRHDQLYAKPVKVGEYDEFHQRCVEQSIDLEVSPDHVLINLSSPGSKTVTSTRAMNFMMEQNPDLFLLWMGGDNLANLLHPDLSIASPFVITFVMEAEEQTTSQGEATRKYMDREKKANSAYAKLFPNVTKQAQEWKDIRERLNSNETCLVRYYFNVTAFCPDEDEAALVCEQQVINTFKKNGIELISPVYMQFRNWLAMLPFIHGEDLWEDIKKGGGTCRAESRQVVNLAPVVADNRLCPGGLLTPSYRNQLAFLDIYGDGMGNTNYNMAVSGTSGAGKTNLVQPILRSVLESGGIGWVFDMGDGYKSFCENVGGVYLKGSNLKFNPFANISNINTSAERIRDQLAVLASPNGNLDEVHLELLLGAVKRAYDEKKNKARIDDVVVQMRTAREEAMQQNAATIASRLDEVITLLGKYCRDGVYGSYFNSDEPSLSDDARFVVLELGDLDDRPDLLIAVMFSLIIYIEDKMYRTPRSMKKCCTIDEGWKLLNFKNDKVGQFIETGYRTVRRHMGAFITISQNIKDFDDDEASAAAKAAWGNSSFKVILKQDASEFKAYNQKRPNQFSEMERDIIGKFGDAKRQWFSSFMLRINDTCSFHRLFVDPLSRAMFSSQGKDFEFIQQRRAGGISIHEAVYELAWRNFAEEMQELENWEIAR